MELLLLLTALFASLTGAAAGERAGTARQVEQIVQAAEAVQTAVAPAVRTVAPAVARPALRAPRDVTPLAFAAPPAIGRAAPERRLE